VVIEPPETEFRPGRLPLAGLLACIGPLAWIMLLPVVDEDEVPRDAPMTLAAAATPVNSPFIHDRSIPAWGLEVDWAEIRGLW
jgi:hypothetical protein